ncbi:MAG: hypothetical protein Q7J35_15445 [Candidatus Methanoperedens sp.]|nr:hypothetical protein [Candidatus Methanoperedens sp.]
MPEKRIKIPAERVLFEVSKDGVAILDTTTEMKEMDGNTTALCDLCSVAIGPMNNVQYIESPEAISRAVKHGYRPEEMLRKSTEMLESMGETNEAYIREIMDKTLKSWIEMVDKSETPWALCDNCHGTIKAYIKHKEVYK